MPGSYCCHSSSRRSRRGGSARDAARWASDSSSSSRHLPSLLPWVARNRATIGCATITTDTRALWKANNPATYDVLARGGWIDDVPDLPGVPPWPEKAASISVAAAKAVDECAQASFYRDEVFDFWRDQPGEKARLARAGGRDAVVAASQRRGGRPGPAGARRRPPAHGRARVRPRALPARASGARGWRRAASSSSPRCSSPTTRSRPWSSPGRCATGCPGTSCSRCSPRSRSNAPGSCVRERRRPAASERRAVELDGAGGAPLLGELLDRPGAPRVSERGRARVVRREGADRIRELPHVGGRDEQPGPAVLDDLGKPSDGARDHGPAALHRLERHHPEPLAE